MATWRFFRSGENSFDVIADAGDVIDERDAAIADVDGIGADDAPERSDAGAERPDARDHETLRTKFAMEDS